MTDHDADYSLPPAHPAFSAHFTDALYDDPADELAPFGSDEGADTLTMWAERRSDLSESTTMRDLLEADVDDVDEFMSEAANLGPDIDGAIIGAGFTLIRLTGRIDDEGRRWTTEALERALSAFNDPTTARMLEDLKSFA